MCFFIKKSRSLFIIIIIYIDYLNIIETRQELPKAIDYLKGEFQMKDLRKTWPTN